MDSKKQLENELFKALQEILYLKRLVMDGLIEIEDFDELLGHLQNAYNIIKT